VRASIVDVARHAGVGTGTVSRVLSGHPHVRPATRARVQAAIEALGYRPNVLARGLVQGRTCTIGLVVFGLHNPFFGLLTQGVEAAASARGYNVLIADSTGSVERQERCIDMLAARHVDGIVVAPIHSEEQELAPIRAAGVKAVLLNSTAGDETVSSVGGDNVRGGYLATRHLLDLGHRRIAFVGHLHSISGCRERQRGYYDALTAGGVSPDPALVVEDVPSMSEIGATMHHLLDVREPPTAVVAMTDEYAIAIMQALHALERRVPQDIALVGYDDIPVAAWLSCPLTTVAQAKEEQGSLAADLLIDQIENPDTPMQRIILPPSLVVRWSCGAALARQTGTAAAR
jgi:DNA-binding LacI/PurR family transcriptional regulator